MAYQRVFSSPHPILPSFEGSMIGAGITDRKKQYITHTTLGHGQSAYKTFWTRQIVGIGVLLGIVLFGFINAFWITLQIMVGIISVVYFIDVIFNCFLITRSLAKPQELSSPRSERLALKPGSLPMYSILCPLYKEAAVLPQFVKAMDNLDWPKDKLDILLLLEADDTQTIEAAQSLHLPSHFRIVIVPDSQPKTKPKACNYGLGLAKGEYVVIYDAEDIPETAQLKKAYIGFKKSPRNVVCLQAKLNYYNPSQNWLTKFFTAEYSLWFDLTLTGLQSLQTALPLGGTSNHFRTDLLRALKGWDTFNVTEDADLGIRLFKEGYKTALIDSVTLEEANSRPRNWLRQRSRWIKGYMQSYLVHMRNPFRFVQQHGRHALYFQMIIGSKLTFIFLNPVLWLITIAYFTLYRFVGPQIEMMYVAWVFYIAAVSLVFGNFFFYLYYLAAMAKREEWSLIRYTLFIPVYWIMISAAGWIAFYQLLLKPHYWEKTVHGFHLMKKPKQSPQKALPYGQKGTVPQSVAPRGSFATNFFAFSKLFQPKPRHSSQKPSILIFNWRDIKHVWAGGAEVYIHEIARRWVKQGNTVTLFCGNDGHSLHNETLQGVKIIRRGGTYTVYAWALLYYLFVLRNKYDVIIDCENGIPFFTPLYVRKPVFLLIHHVHQEVFRQYLPKFIAGFLAALERIAMPFIYRERPVITVSESSKTEILHLGFTRPEAIHIVYNGIEPDQFATQPKTQSPSFIYLGRLKPHKNIDVCMKAFAKILKNYPHASLHIVGEGESLPELTALAKRLHLESSVQFYGKVTEAMKAHLLSKSWAMIQPSSIEGWGITVIEANAAGTTVIASDVPGLRDSVLHNKTGTLVTPKSSTALSLAMVNIIENSALRHVLALQAHSWARNFTWDKSAQAFYTVIESEMNREEISYASLALAKQSV